MMMLLILKFSLGYINKVHQIIQTHWPNKHSCTSYRRVCYKISLSHFSYPHPLLHINKVAAVLMSYHHVPSSAPYNCMFVTLMWWRMKAVSQRVHGQLLLSQGHDHESAAATVRPLAWLHSGRKKISLIVRSNFTHMTCKQIINHY